jgi:hypothetical protein
MDGFEDPTDRWALVFYGDGWSRPTHTHREWAHIAHAMTTADTRCAETLGLRGDASWCAIAADTYTTLRAADTNQPHSDSGESWVVDEHLVRTWLGSPVFPPGESAQTILDADGWLSAVDPVGRPDPADLTLLVDHVQHLGLVGAPHHKVSVLRWVDQRVIRNDAFFVLLWPPDGPARASSAIHVNDLVPPAPSRTDRIVAVLTSVASVANQLLTATPQTKAITDVRGRAGPTLPTGVDGHTVGGRRPRIAPITNQQPHQSPVQPPTASPAPLRRART